MAKKKTPAKNMELDAKEFFAAISDIDSMAKLLRELYSSSLSTSEGEVKIIKG